MKANTRAILCDPELVAIRDRHLQRLAALFTGAQPERPFFLQGIGGSGSSDPYTRPERWVEEALDSLAGEAARARDEKVFRPLCLEFGAYGVHFTDRILGARVRESNGIWWAERVAHAVGELAEPDLEREATWRLARATAAVFLACDVRAPLFGMPVIAGALTVAVSLYGPDFLAALRTAPEAARRDLALINGVTRRLYRWYFERVPAAQLQQVQAPVRCMPPGHVSLYGCTSHLLSAELYREFGAPPDAELLASAPAGGLIHLCGDHRRHIPAWRAMPALRAVQLNDRAAEDLEYYFNELRPDQAIYLHPTATMTVPRALALTGGKRLVLVAEPD